MQSSYLFLRPSSSDGGGSFFVPCRKPLLFPGLWPFSDSRSRRPAPPPAAMVGGDPDHYAVLGLSRGASAADVKRAYRLLARKYHPDVSRNLQAGEVFKRIHSAYEVLSDEVRRAQYDRALMFEGTTDKQRWKKWTNHPDDDDLRRRILRWEELRQRMHYESQQKQYSWHADSATSHKDPSYNRAPFSEVLRFAFFTLFFVQTLGYRASLTLCGLAALLDNHLDAGYKMGYIIAWLLGGQGGVLLTLCMNFTCWLCGKNNSSLVAVMIIAMWAGASLARFAPLPQGAVLALLYMSIKLQVDMK